MPKTEIMLSTYLNEVFMEICKNCYSGTENETIDIPILKIHADIFVNVFGKEVAEKLVSAYEDSDTSRDFDYEYYRTLVSLYKNLNEADVEEFINCVKSNCNKTMF